MGAAILKLDRDRKLLNPDVTSTYPVDIKSVEPVQNHVNKCEERIIPELNGIILLKITSWIIYNHISLSQKKPGKRKMIQMAQILTLNRNCNLRQSRERSCDVRAFQFFFFPPSNLASGAAVMALLQYWSISLCLWYQVYFVIIIVEILVTALSITYLKKCFLSVVNMHLKDFVSRNNNNDKTLFASLSLKLRYSQTTAYFSLA